MTSARDRRGGPATGAPPVDPLAWWTVRGLRMMLVVRAVLALVIGVVALAWPELTLLALAVAFGVYAILDGVARIVDAVRHRGRERWWLGLLGGLVGVAAGVVALFWPGVTALVLAIIVGAWAVVTGAAEIADSVRLRRAGGRVWLLALAGVLSLVAGIVILVWPVQGAIGLALLFGAFALAYGVLLGVLAATLRPSAP
jgi:uncharacterized membrane protein HdeD (DUF308 family)